MSSNLTKKSLDYAAQLRAELLGEDAPASTTTKTKPPQNDWGRTESEEALAREIAEEARTQPVGAEDPGDWAWPEDAPSRQEQKNKQEPAAAKPADQPKQAGALVRRELTSHSRQTTLMNLAKQGVKNVKVLGLDTVQRIVENAVSTALERSAITRTEAEREAIEEEARREFYTLLKRHKQLLAEKSQGKQRQEFLTGQVDELREELARAEVALQSERRSQSPKLAPEDIDRLERSFRDLLDAFMTDNRRHQLIQEDPRALNGLNDLEKKLGAAFDRLLDRVKSDTEELLERRISKLNRALEETETALRRLAKAKGYDEGLASIYDSIQGLSPEELDYARKKELLAIVFVENLEIQNVEVTDADRALADGALETLDHARPEPALTLPAGFRKPVELPATDVAF